MLTIHSVTKRFGALAALDDVSLDIAEGEFFGLLGPNGAGKSTIMSLVAGLRSPDEGELNLDGEPLAAGGAKARRHLGFVPQSIALFQGLTAEENLRIFGQLQGLRGAVLNARLDEAFEAAQLGDRRRSMVWTFSGGMQRRLNLVAALLHRPRLLLCDEPTVGVDPQSRNAIFECLEPYGETAALDGTCRFRPAAGYPLSAFFALTESLRLSPRLFKSERPTLEAVFLHLAGRKLRDA